MRIGMLGIHPPQSLPSVAGPNWHIKRSWRPSTFGRMRRGCLGMIVKQSQARLLKYLNAWMLAALVSQILREWSLASRRARYVPDLVGMQKVYLRMFDGVFLSFRRQHVLRKALSFWSISLEIVRLKASSSQVIQTQMKMMRVGRDKYSGTGCRLWLQRRLSTFGSWRLTQTVPSADKNSIEVKFCGSRLLTQIWSWMVSKIRSTNVITHGF